jgi:hypothetical protein
MDFPSRFAPFFSIIYIDGQKNEKSRKDRKLESIDKNEKDNEKN